MAVEQQKGQAPNLDLSEMGQVIGDAVADGIARNAPKKVTVGQYLKRINAGRAVLRRPSSQNGYEMRADNLSNEEIGLLNRISRSGRYIDRRVEVIVRKEGATEEVELRYANKTADMRSELKGFVRSLKEMLEVIVAAQDEENKLDELRKSA